MAKSHSLRSLIAIGILLTLCDFRPLATGCAQSDLFNRYAALLQDTNPDTRLDAIDHLRQLKDPRVLPTLINGFRDPEHKVRQHVVETLASIGEPAVMPLIAVLKDRTIFVRRDAIITLGMIKDPRCAKALTKDLKDPDATTRFAARSTLRDIDPRMLNKLLISELKNPDTKVREEAANWIAGSNDPVAVMPLVAVLRKDSDPQARVLAAHGLGNLKDKRGTKPLIAALEDSDSGVRQNAAISLGRLRDPLAVGPLLLALQAADTSVRGYAEDALGEIGDARTAEPLARAHAFLALAKLGVPAVDPLITLLEDPDTSVRQRSAEALGKIGDKRAVEPLIALLLSSNEWDSAKAAQALGRLKDTRAIEPLLSAVTGKRGWSRMYAAEALVPFRDPRAVAQFLDGFKRGDVTIIVGANVFFIERGAPGSEAELLKALYRWGYEPMGVNLSHCENPQLEAAGRSWLASVHSQHTYTSPNPPTLWGTTP